MNLGRTKPSAVIDGTASFANTTNGIHPTQPINQRPLFFSPRSTTRTGWVGRERALDRRRSKASRLLDKVDDGHVLEFKVAVFQEANKPITGLIKSTYTVGSTRAKG